MEWYRTFLQFLKIWAADQLYLYESNSTKSRRIWPRARLAHAQQSFNFQKFTGTLKWLFVGEHLQIPSFYFKEQWLKIKFQISNLLSIFFFLPKMVKTIFDQKIVNPFLFAGSFFKSSSKLSTLRFRQSAETSFSLFSIESIICGYKVWIRKVGSGSDFATLLLITFVLMNNLSWNHCSYVLCCILLSYETKREKERSK